MAQNTNLNISPYFDDFDDDKGFLKVLFKPGFPVQARELTTLQSLLQNQIDTFGQGVYKEGSMVVPGGITLNRNYPVVLVQNNYLNLPVELYREALNGKVVKGATSNIRARVNFSISATQSTRGYVSFYLTYLTKADDNSTSVFQSGEILTCEEDITYSTSTIVAGTPSGTFSPGTTITQTTTGAKGYVVSYDSTTKVMRYYQDSNDGVTSGNVVEFAGNYEITSSDIVTATPDANFGTSSVPLTQITIGVSVYELGLSFIEGYANGEVEINSGEILYIDNRNPITRSTDQNEELKVVIEF